MSVFQHLVAITIMVTILLILAIISAGCQTPTSPSLDRAKMIRTCAKACGQDLMKSYDPLSGECICRDVLGKRFKTK